jgi:hypothetical protein
MLRTPSSPSTCGSWHTQVLTIVGTSCGKEPFRKLWSVQLSLSQLYDEVPLLFITLILSYHYITRKFRYVCFSWSRFNRPLSSYAILSAVQLSFYTSQLFPDGSPDLVVQDHHLSKTKVPPCKCPTCQASYHLLRYASPPLLPTRSLSIRTRNRGGKLS